MQAKIEKKVKTRMVNRTNMPEKNVRTSEKT